MQHHLLLSYFWHVRTKLIFLYIQQTINVSGNWSFYPPTSDADVIVAVIINAKFKLSGSSNMQCINLFAFYKIETSILVRERASMIQGLSIEALFFIPLLNLAKNAL